MSDELVTGSIQGKVYAWMDRAVDGADPPVERLQLVHFNVAEQAQVLATWRLAGAELADVKGELWTTARQVVGAWSHGPQRFGVRAFHVGQGETAGAYFPFLLAGEPTEGSATDPGSTEPANVIGLQKQLMRHLEAKDRTIAAMSLEMITFQSRSLSQAHRELDAMRVKYHELLEKSEAALANAEDRAIARELVMRGERRKDELAGKAMAALPMLANKLSERLGAPKLFPGAASGPEQVLAEMLSGLDDQRFAHLLAAFPNPTHQAFLLEIIKAEMQKRKEAESAEPPRH